MPTDPAERARVETMLGEVIALLQQLLAARSAWNPTAEQMAFLEEVATFTGPHLPPQALKSGTVAIAFLLAAKGSLELTLRQLDFDDE